MPDYVHISRSISKLGMNIPSVNLPPVCTCRDDAPCKKLCYARKGRFAFKHNVDLLDNNLRVWKENARAFEYSVIAAAYSARYFRWHSAGDIPDMNYLRMMVRVAQVCGATQFLCFTKKYELVDEYVEHGGEVPDNLHIVYSAWGALKPENKFRFPVSYIRFKKGEADIPVHAHQCSGYCGDCVMSGQSCWDLRRGTDDCVVFNQH